MKNLNLYLILIIIALSGCGEENPFSYQIRISSFQYEHSVKINGVVYSELHQKNTGMQLGLFHENHPVKSKALDDQKKLFCVNKVENEIEITYKKLDSNNLHTEFKVEIVSPDGKTTYYKFIPKDGEGKVSAKYYLPEDSI